MKQQINEIKRMQQLAGVINEAERNTYQFTNKRLDRQFVKLIDSMQNLSLNIDRFLEEYKFESDSTKMSDTDKQIYDILDKTWTVLHNNVQKFVTIKNN